VECPDGGSMNEIGNVYDFVGYTAEKLIELKLNRKIIGMNFRTTLYAHVDRFKKLLPNAEIVDFRLDRIRIIKTKDEQECQFRAAKANQDALMDTINEIEVGWSERDVVNCIARHHRKHLGNDYERSILAHCHVGENLEYMHLSNLWPPERETKKVKKGDLIYLEPGTFYKRYAGTMLRTFSVGEPSPKARRSILACIEVLNRTIEAYAPGKTGHEIDKIGRDYFVKMGLECRSRIGYCNGIDWSGGDVMSIIPNNPLILVPGHIFHCIALTYLPGFGYIGMSEQLLVTEDGHEVLGDRDRTCERKLLVI
jgi:Xaa-Pro aminopeptidase